MAELVDTLLRAKRSTSNRKAVRNPRRPKWSTYRSSRGRKRSGAYGRILRHFTKLAGRTLNELQSRRFQIPDADLLADGLYAYGRSQLGSLLRDSEPGGAKAEPFARWATVDVGELEKLSLKAAEAALGRWTPDYIEIQRRRGRRGGQVGKRRSRWDKPGQLDALAALDGLTHAEAGTALDPPASVSTVERGRARLRGIESGR